jgi:hypothetical protein
VRRVLDSAQPRRYHPGADVTDTYDGSAPVPAKKRGPTPSQIGGAAEPAPLGAGPRADYVCERCDPEGEHPFEAPVKGAHCSSCGRRKWMRRLYNHVNISKPGFYEVNRLADREGARQMEKYHDQRDAFGRQVKEGTSTFAVPVGNNGAIGMGVEKHLQRTPLAAAAQGFRGLTVTPGASPSGMPRQEIVTGPSQPKAVITHRDSTKVAKRVDGIVEIVK